MTTAGRSRIMRAIRTANTRPEIAVRRLLHAMGYRFRLHRRDLPGTPDITLPGRRAVIFVHGCFWHQHPGCPKGRQPAHRQEYWGPKLMRNVERDTATASRLREQGWTVIVVWECELADPESVRARLSATIPAQSEPRTAK